MSIFVYFSQFGPPLGGHDYPHMSVCEYSHNLHQCRYNQRLRILINLFRYSPKAGPAISYFSATLCHKIYDFCALAEQTEMSFIPCHMYVIENSARDLTGCKQRPCAFIDQCQQGRRITRSFIHIEFYFLYKYI